MGNLTVSNYNPYAAAAAQGPLPASPPAVTTPGSNPIANLAGMGSDFSSISSLVAHAGGGGFASFKLAGKMADSYKTLFGHPPAPPAGGTAAATSGFAHNLMAGFKGIAVTGLKGAGLSALVSAGVSAVANGVGAATGQVDGAEAMSNVVKDTIGGAVGGLTAVTAGGLGALVFHGGGVLGTVVSVGLGAVGGVVGGQIAKKLTDNF